MANYKFDGKVLKSGGKIIANVIGNNIRKGSGGSVVANIKGDKVREGSGGSILFNLRGTDIRKGSGGSILATMKDVEKAIDGHGGITLAALWYCFVR